MGKASRWFRGLLGLKKDSSSQPAAAAKPPKRRWSFVKSLRERDRTTATNSNDDGRGYSHGNIPPPTSGYADLHAGGVDPSKHAIAVAAATAAVAEAAVAAAHAAAAVVRLTSSGRSNASTNTSVAYGGVASCGIREQCAAINIQAHFRGYLLSSRVALSRSRLKKTLPSGRNRRGVFG
ncbi:IQ-domain [Sarracenia purpurea var. burkii]